MAGAVGAAQPLDFSLVVLALLASITLPVFTFALSQDRGTLHFSKSLRRLAMAAAVVLTLLFTSGLPEWLGRLVEYSRILPGLPPGAVASDPRTIYNISTFLSEVSSLSLILLLVAIFRHEDNEPDLAASHFLRIATRTAFVALGLWLLFNLIRGLLAPYTYAQLRQYMARMGRPAPPAITIVGELMKAMLSAACVFSVPYIVSKGISAQDAPPQPATEPAPETHLPIQ